MSNTTKPSRWASLKLAFASGSAIESRGRTVNGFWCDWRDAPDPQWHENGDVEYRLKRTFELLTELSKTPEGVSQIRLMMAELDGWEPFLMDDGSPADPPRWISPVDGMACTLKYIPNYPEDLDAVSRLEGKLTFAQQWSWAEELRKSWAEELRKVTKTHGEAYQKQKCLTAVLWACARATALQRCIVLLLTKPPENL